MLIKYFSGGCLIAPVGEKNRIETFTRNLAPVQSVPPRAKRGYTGMRVAGSKGPREQRCCSIKALGLVRGSARP